MLTLILEKVLNFLVNKKNRLSNKCRIVLVKNLKCQVVQVKVKNLKKKNNNCIKVQFENHKILQPYLVLRWTFKVLQNFTSQNSELFITEYLIKE